MIVFSAEDLLVPHVSENSPNYVFGVYHLDVEYDDEDIKKSCSKKVTFNSVNPLGEGDSGAITK